MQSIIGNDFKIKTFKASFAEMKQFKKYVEELEIKCANECAFKITPPRRFESYSNGLPQEAILSNVVTQRADEIITHNDVAYELSYEEQRSMTHNQFMMSVAQNEPVFDSINNCEEAAWLNLQNASQQSLYAIDNPVSLFDESCKFMNLNTFSRAESLIHQGDELMGGIHKPYLYVGSYLTYFGIHLEDSDLCSINYLHEGAAKVWYFIPSSEHGKLERLAERFGRAVGITCDNFLRHKSLMIPPAILRKNGIRFSRVIQNPNEFVISLSGGYHFGFNCGLNKAEAINFATRRWLEYFPKFKPCHCRGRHANETRRVGYALTEIHARELMELQRREAYICEYCIKTFTTKSSIQRHMINTHMKKVQKFNCDECNLLFSRKSNLIIHVQNQHQKQLDINVIKTRIIMNNLPKNKSKTIREPLMCGICKILVHGRDSLKRHQQNKH